MNPCIDSSFAAKRIPTFLKQFSTLCWGSLTLPGASFQVESEKFFEDLFIIIGLHAFSESLPFSPFSLCTSEEFHVRSTCLLCLQILAYFHILFHSRLASKLSVILIFTLISKVKDVN